jgi:hypothetical protein
MKSPESNQITVAWAACPLEVMARITMPHGLSSLPEKHGFAGRDFTACVIFACPAQGAPTAFWRAPCSSHPGTFFILKSFSCGIFLRPTPDVRDKCL